MIGVVLPVDGPGIIDRKVVKSFKVAPYILIARIDEKRKKVVRDIDFYESSEVKGEKLFQILKRKEVTIVMSPSEEDKEIAEKIGAKFKKVEEGADVQELLGSFFEEEAETGKIELPSQEEIKKAIEAAKPYLEKTKGEEEEEEVKEEITEEDWEEADEE